jgi:hypothetical protein
MSGHTPWNEIKHKKKRGAPAMQIAVYDLTGKTLPEDIVDRVADAVANVVKKYDTLAHSVITE